MSDEEQTQRILELKQLVASLAFFLLQKEAKFEVLNLMVVSLLKELKENETIDATKLAESFSSLARPLAASAVEIHTFLQRTGLPENTFKYGEAERYTLQSILGDVIEGLLKPLRS